ncbi:MAG: DUF6421 family protein, partial [Bacilli bacterium]
MHTLEDELAKIVNEQLAPVIHQFQQLQHVNGHIIGDFTEAKRLLNEITILSERVYEQLGLYDYLSALKRDLKEWLDRGLCNPPTFDRLTNAYMPPRDGELTFFVGTMVTFNGRKERGYFMEAFLGKRCEPHVINEVRAVLPNPKGEGVKAMHLLAGTDSYVVENCIVFYPENVRTPYAMMEQRFALLFFNKFQDIYLRESYARAKQIFPDFPFVSAALSAEETYDARVVWSYLHDYFHQTGKKPFYMHIATRMNFYAGLLEEVKVELQCLTEAKRLQLPYCDEIAEFILFERLLRYPNLPNARKNFDLGMGYFLYAWFAHYGGVFTRTEDEHLQLDVARLIEASEPLIQKIVEIERIEDDELYIDVAEQFVCMYVER